MKRKAVSLLLTRDPDSTEVYLVERNPKLRFFGGYFAFPGGTIDKGDGAIAVQNAQTLPAESAKYLAAAAREIFEETGILLGHGDAKIPQERLRSYRQQLLNDQIGFADILEAEKLSIDAQDFHFMCSILTPEFAPVRYDTQFYRVHIRDDQSPEIWPGELISDVFLTAETALQRWRAGEMDIVPPVVFMLKELQGRSIRSFVPVIREYAEAYRRGEIHQVYFTPGIQVITLKTRTLPPATHTNTFLVGESGLYIIDPAPPDPGEQARLWDYLEDRLREGCVFKGILLTHHHSDHIGALTECQQRYQLPIMAHKKTAEKLPHIKFSRFLKHGDELELGAAPDGQPGWKLKVYHTPGHAPGHLAFQEDRYGAVIAGDMISTLSTIVISPPEGHMATYLKSLEFLREVTTGAIYPSHGPVMKAGRSVLEFFLKHRKEREEKLLHALGTNPQSMQDLVKKVYDDVDPQTWPLAEHSLLAHLEKLIEEGRCRKEDERFVLA